MRFTIIACCALILWGCNSPAANDHYTVEFSTGTIHVRGYWATRSVDLISGERERCCKYFGMIDFAPGYGYLHYEPDEGKVDVSVSSGGKGSAYVKEFKTDDLSPDSLKRLLEEAQRYRHSDQWKQDSKAAKTRKLA